VRKPVCENFGGFFHPIKVCQQKGRQDSIQAVCRRKRRLEGFLYEAAKNFLLLLLLNLMLSDITNNTGLKNILIKKNQKNREL
jgi:hypothetical protein